MKSDELNVLVGRHLLGFMNIGRDNMNWWMRDATDAEKTIFPECAERQPLLQYSTEISAAWTLIEFLLDKRGVQMQLSPIGYNGGWQCKRIDPGGNAIASANYAPEAICIAALLTVGIDVNEMDRRFFREAGKE